MTKASTHALPGPDDITRVVLDNGMIVLIRENHSAPVIVLEGNLPGGALYDPLDKIGLSSFVAAMLTRGSVAYDFDTFNETIESVGASLGVSSGVHAIDFSITSLSEDFPQMVDVLADIVRRPTFPNEQMKIVRGQKMVALQEREQDTGRVASLRFSEALYGKSHPYGRSISGYLETVPSITREDLIAFHQHYYTPNGAVLVIVGDVQTQAILDLVNHYFGDWHGPRADTSVPLMPARTTSQQLHYPIEGKIQSDIVIGCQGIARSHPDYTTMRVANSVLGKFGMMGRLGERVREEQGLAYYSYSTMDVDLHGGAWMAIAGVNPGNVQKAVESILIEFERLANEPVPEAELGDSQAYMTGIVPLTLETNDGVASTLLNMEWYQLGLDYLQRYREMIYEVTPVDVQRVAQTYLRTDQYLLVVAGPGELPDLSLPSS